MTDQDQDDEEAAASAGLPPNQPNYITPAGFDRLRTELQLLLRDERPRIVEIVSWAAGNGDRSENGDYIYGKRRLREIDRRIRFLTKRLEISKIVRPEEQTRRDQVFFGAWVLYARADGRENCIRIVGVDEVNLDANEVTWVSPIARALWKAREGDIVQLKTPAGVEPIEILEIDYDQRPA